MASLVYVTATGAAVSVGNVIADPLPAGMTAHVLTGAEFDGLRDGSLKWDPGTLSVVVDAARAAELAAEAAAVAERAGLPADIPLLVTERDDANLARDQMTVGNPAFLAKWAVLGEGPTPLISRTGATAAQITRLFDAVDAIHVRLDALARLGNNLVADQRKQHGAVRIICAALVRKLRADRNDTT